MFIHYSLYFSITNERKYSLDQVPKRSVRWRVLWRMETTRVRAPLCRTGTATETLIWKSRTRWPWYSSLFNFFYWFVSLYLNTWFSIFIHWVCELRLSNGLLRLFVRTFHEQHSSWYSVTIWKLTLCTLINIEMWREHILMRISVCFRSGTSPPSGWSG